MRDASPGAHRQQRRGTGFLSSVPSTVRRSHLRVMARRRGLLMAAQGSAGHVVVTGLGDRLVVATRQRVRVLPARAVARVPRVLARYGVYEGRAEPAAWDAGDLSLLLAREAAPGDVLLLDEEEWHLRSEGDLFVPSDEPPEELVLEELSWDLPGGAGSPGSDDWGWERLVRLGPCFLRWQGALGSWDLLDAADEDEARALVRAWDQVSRGLDPEG